MFNIFAQLSFLFAQAADAGAPQASAPNSTGSGGGPFDMMIFMLPLLLIVFWFFVLRPQQKQDENHRKLLGKLEKNDRVYTVSGLIGTVHSIDENKKEIVLKVDDSNGTKIRFLTAAIVGLVPKDGEKEKEKSAS